MVYKKATQPDKFQAAKESKYIIDQTVLLNEPLLHTLNIMSQSDKKNKCLQGKYPIFSLIVGLIQIRGAFVCSYKKTG